MRDIQRRDFEDADRLRAQDLAIQLVTQDMPRLLAEYEADPRSKDGRYVCSDLFKERFPFYAASAANRARLNAPVHNAAAVLAAEQFERVAERPQQSGLALVVTGSPGAGKTSFITQQPVGNFDLLYEGQINNRADIHRKLDRLLAVGLKPAVLVVHNTPERSLRQVLQRFAAVGRGASLELMASIQSGIPTALRGIREAYGDRIGVVVRDFSDAGRVVAYRSDEAVRFLETFGAKDVLLNRLRTELERLRGAGELSPGALEQASGMVPRPSSGPAGPGHPDPSGKDEHGPRVPG